METPINNPYPGATSLQSGRQELLVGRRDDVENFVKMVQSRRLVELTAPSGLGKSSLLEAGLIPALDSLGYVAVVVRDWADIVGDDDVPSQYVAAVRSGFKAALRPGRETSRAAHLAATLDPGLNDEELIDHLDSLCGKKLVVIFDQFEELMRDDPATADNLMLMISELINGDEWLKPFVHVISLRSEYKDELVPLERALAPGQFDLLRLEPVADVYVDAMVRVPLAAEPGIAIDEAAVDSVAALIRTVLSDPANARTHEIGLLHVQALLWLIGEVLVESRRFDGATMSARTVARRSDETPADLLRRALGTYIDQRLSGRRAGQVSADDAVADMVARVSAHLSSGGFKLIRDTDELFGLAFPRLADLGVAREASDIIARVARLWFAERAHDHAGEFVRAEDVKFDPADLADLLARGELERYVSGIGEEAMRALEVTRASFAAGSDMPAGDFWANSSNPERVVAELLYRYEIALQTMFQESLIRLTRVNRTQGRRLSLVHDGFGQPLASWGRGRLADFGTKLREVTKLSGVQVIGDVASQNPDQRCPLVEIALIDRVGWLGCNGTAHFKDLVFRHCDFKGMVFNRCVFENVTFEDCDLAGTLFFGGQIRGVLTVRNTKGASVSSNTLTFKRLDFTDATLRLDGLGGQTNVASYGIFIDDCVGGAWEIVGCAVDHVGFVGGVDSRYGLGSIARSTITHLTIAANQEQVTVDAASMLTLVSGNLDQLRRPEPPN